MSFFGDLWLEVRALLGLPCAFAADLATFFAKYSIDGETFTESELRRLQRCKTEDEAVHMVQRMRDGKR